MILRENYLKKIEKYIDVPLVKILVGVRRSGKSTILEMVINLLKERGVNSKNIIYMRLDDVEYLNRLDAKTIYQEIKSKIDSLEGKAYVLLDEIQEVENWEKMVNSIVVALNSDVYVTGSNSKLMSSEISTHLSGRYVTIPVFTLSFEEYLLFKGKEVSNVNLEDEFNLFLKEGGLPGILLANLDDYYRYSAIKDIYNTVIVSDIIDRYEIRHKDLFDRIVRFIFDNVGKTFSANSIKNFLKNEGRSVNIETIYNYISYLERSFIVYRCNRIDLQGKAILKTLEKYYLSDQSFKYALFGFSPSSISAMIENIVYLEMKRRGFEVYVGKIGNKEIDFYGIRNDEKIYIQITLSKPQTSLRETKNLLAIKDNHPKYIVTLDKLFLGNEQGIEIMYLPNFLLDKSW